MPVKAITPFLLQCFTWSFVISVCCFIGLIAYGAMSAEQIGVAPVEIALFSLMVAAGPVWYVSLGVIAHRLGRRWLVWTGLSFITVPVGPFVAASLMLGHIRTARAASSLIVPPTS